MERKDCDMVEHFFLLSSFARHRRSIAMVLACCAGLIATPVANAGTLRVWPSAVVTDKNIRLGDVCAFTGFTAEQAEAMESMVVSASPAPAESRLIPLELIRSVLEEHNVNLATVNLGGAIQCSVTRPSVVDHVPEPNRKRSAGSAELSDNNQAHTPANQTVADAVRAFFRNELHQYDGVVEVRFGRTSEQVLGLSSPAFRFVIRKRTGPPLGLVSLVVDVIEGEQTVRSIPMAVQIQLRRKILMARRAINQGATIAASDVELVATTATRIDRTLVNDRASVIGQRARRFIAVGVSIRQNMIESVPLVKRGQIVTLSSVNGGINIVTTAKAAEDGKLGDVIRVMSVENRKLAFHAEVVGVGYVRMNADAAALSSAAVALGGGR